MTSICKYLRLYLSVFVYLHLTFHTLSPCLIKNVLNLDFMMFTFHDEIKLLLDFCCKLPCWRIFVLQEVLLFPAMKPDDNKPVPPTEGTSV